MGTNSGKEHVVAVTRVLRSQTRRPQLNATASQVVSPFFAGNPKRSESTVKAAGMESTATSVQVYESRKRPRSVSTTRPGNGKAGAVHSADSTTVHIDTLSTVDHANAVSPTTKHTNDMAEHLDKAKDQAKANANNEAEPLKGKSFGPPANWQTLWHRLVAYRRTIEAPVDTVGCDRLFAPEASPKSRRFHILLALLLSSQTKDGVTAEAMRQLHERVGKRGKEGVTVEAVLQTEERIINECIAKVGFHRKKTQFIKQVSQILRDRYNDDIPTTAQEIMAMPGLGPKMAHLAVQAAWGSVEGIGVDTHVHRISSRFQWVPRGTYEKGPEATRMALESWLPQEHWADINSLLVGLGQTVCQPRNPLCGQCQLRDICPSSTAKKTKTKVVEIKN